MSIRKITAAFVLLTALVGCVTLAQAPAPAPTGAAQIIQTVVSPPPPSGKSLLSPSDFTLLGYYNVQTNGNDSPYGQALTGRVVNGDFRLLTLTGGNSGTGGRLHEISLTGKAFGANITTPTRVWAAIGGLNNFSALWWDEVGQRLWTSATIDYTITQRQVQVFTRTLNNDGTVANLHGPVGLQGIPEKRAYGGCLAVPTWFRTAYQANPYLCGWGGYTSLVAQSGAASLGPTIYTMPDPAGYVNSTEVSTASYRVIADNVWGTTHSDWYASGAPTAGDRGSRLTIPVNYFDGGDPRQNPSSRPTVPPVAGAHWLSPAPDGNGRFVWGDSYYNTGVWIDGPTKQGFLLVASLCGGSCWYQTSTLAYDSRVFELHIFDPNTLGQAATGTLAPWKVKPASMTQLTLAGMGLSYAGNGPIGNIGGATYDPVTKRLYLIGFGVSTFWTRVFVFQVNA